MAKKAEGHILLIESQRRHVPHFAASLRRRGYTVQVVPSGAAALDYLQQHPVDLTIVHAASLGSTGRRICARLRQAAPQMPLLLILDEHRLPDGVSPADVVLHLPFTPRKLLNRVRRLLPAEGKRILRQGPIELDLDHHRVRCLGRETRLTPKLTALLAALLRRPGKVWPREELFTQVWQTTYTSDTRTLDVHISWLRRAIEPDPRNPRFLKTVRGVGYRLDVDEVPPTS